MAKVGTIARANLVRFLRDPFNYFFVFLFPLGLILIIGVAFGSGAAPKLGVVAGHDAAAERFIADLSDANDGRVVRANDVDELRRRVEDGGLAAGVVLPPDLSASLATGEDVQLEFLSTSGGAGSAFQFSVAAAAGAVSERVRAARYLSATTGESAEAASALVDEVASSAAPLSVKQEWSGESAFGDVQAFEVSAASQLVLFVFLTGLTSASALILTRQLGVSRRMLGTPTGVGTIVVGEALGRYLVALFQGAYIIVATRLLFGVEWGSPLAALLVLAAFAAVAAGVGMLLGATFDSDQQATGVAILAGLGLAALGGAMVPLELFGPTMRTVARFVPHSWAVDAYSQLLRHGAGVLDVLPQIGVLLAFAVLFFGLAAWRLRARLLGGG